MKSTTATQQSVKSSSVINTNDLSNLPKLPNTLEALQLLRTAKGKDDSFIHASLNKALAECKKENMILLLERIMIHIGDISRQHNMLREMGVISPTGGAQERAVFRSCLRWWEKNLPESFIKNIPIIVGYTLYENLMFYEVKTDRLKGTLLKTEILFPCPQNVYEFLANKIRSGTDLNLIARHLPKYHFANDKTRTAKKVVKLRDGQTEMKWTLPEGKSWAKVNGVFVDGKSSIVVRDKDVLSYPRNKQSFVLAKEKFVNNWIENFCKHMGWTIQQYREFRKLQSTPEQSFASKNILKVAKSDYMKMLDRLTSGQRFRVAKMVAYKDSSGKLVAKDKWNDLGTWYIEWENNQEKIADELRKVAMTGDEKTKSELMSKFKVKATGQQTIDLLAELFKGTLSDTQVNNSYQALVEKMDLIANVFPIIDGSGSMNSGIVHQGVQISNRKIAYAMAIAFSTRNPVDAFRNTYGWFSSRFTICGRSKFVNEAPNPFVDKNKFTKKVEDHQVLSEHKTFTENLSALASSDPGEISSTNMFSSIEYFVDLVKNKGFHAEDLPGALLYITDNENNMGRTPKDAIALANSIGWHPLLIFWGLTVMSEHSVKNQLKGVPNTLFVGGFNEGALSQILRGIKSGSINPETELWSIYNDIRYSILS